MLKRRSGSTHAPRIKDANNIAVRRHQTAADRATARDDATERADAEAAKQAATEDAQKRTDAARQQADAAAAQRTEAAEALNIVERTRISSDDPGAIHHRCNELHCHANAGG